MRIQEELAEINSTLAGRSFHLTGHAPNQNIVLVEVLPDGDQHHTTVLHNVTEEDFALHFYGTAVPGDAVCTSGTEMLESITELQAEPENVLVNGMKPRGRK